MVYPENQTQLEFAVVFKLFEKLYEMILSIFGKTGEEIDGSLADWFAGLIGRAEDTVTGK